MIRWLAGALLYAAIIVPSWGQDQAARLDQAVQSYVASKQFMGAVLVAHGGRVLLNRGYGEADLENGAPNGPATRFRIGSITKQFTAAGVLLLEERGKLKLSDPLKKYLPYIPASWNSVTLLQLLTHTSGIYDITDLPDFDSRIKRLHLTARQSLALIEKRPLDFPPGTRFHYSSSGYLALGAVIEKVTGKSYARFLSENIFVPLGMGNTGYSSSAAMPNLAMGYQLKNGAFAAADFIDMSVPFSAGALYSTTHDLLTWEEALFAGKVLSVEDARRMSTAYRDNYGFGLSVRTADGHRLVDHAGDIDGFSAMLRTYPDDDLTIVVLGNVASPAPFHITDDLGRIALEAPR